MTPPPTTLHVSMLKLDLPISPDAIPLDLVPPEPAPAGSPVLDIALDGDGLTLRAVLNGKSLRRALKVLAEHGAGGVFAKLQGQVRPPAAPGEPYRLADAGLAIVPKTPKAPAKSPEADPTLAPSAGRDVKPPPAAPPAAAPLAPRKPSAGRPTADGRLAAARPAPPPSSDATRNEYRAFMREHRFELPRGLVAILSAAYRRLERAIADDDAHERDAAAVALRNKLRQAKEASGRRPRTGPTVAALDR